MIFQTEWSGLELEGSNVYEFSNRNSDFLALVKNVVDYSYTISFHSMNSRVLNQTGQRMGLRTIAYRPPWPAV